MMTIEGVGAVQCLVVLDELTAQDQLEPRCSGLVRQPGGGLDGRVRFRRGDLFT